MSTNYYARTADTPEGEDGLHIGQAATGWEFLWRGHPGLGLVSVANWREYLHRPGVTIVDEYGDVLTASEFLTYAASTAVRQPRREANTASWCDNEADGVPFADYEFC